MSNRTNALINEKSPYLLMHAQNPVNWYPWDTEALNKAKNENKLMVISIGYAACHWCHVMEKESFSDVDVAALMNQDFVSIKIDREERPDLDQVFMDVAHLTTGKGGWPLNIITLPDGTPVFAGTYFQKRQWINLLNEINQIFNNQPERLVDLGKQIKDGIERMDFVGLVKDSALFTEDSLQEAITSWKDNLDMVWGGNIGAPKFPMPVEFNFFLSYLSNTEDETLLNYVNTSLTRMAFGGIFDHLGGGFARYSVDEFWKVPHFEKMLYDQGQLIEVYSKAYRLTKNPLYKKVVEETIAFITRELKTPEGGFYSAKDADSEGEEGKYYVWTKSEIEALLGDEASLFCEVFNISESGNWEQGKNVLFQTQCIQEFADRLNVDFDELNSKLNKSKQILYKQRITRTYPLLDDKILTSWNAIAIKGLVQAYKALGNEAYLNQAIESSEFIKAKAFQDNGALWRSLKGDKGSINAFLDDYAMLIDAWIDLYQVTFDEQWILLSNSLLEYVRAHFFNEDNQLFYYASVLDEPLLVRKSEISDNVIPASNSVMAINIYRLSKYFLHKEGYHTSLQMLKNLSGKIDEHGKYYANWQRLKLFFIYGTNELVISGGDIKNAHNELITDFNPFVFLASADNNLPITEGKNSKDLTFYICNDNACGAPVHTVEDALLTLKHNNNVRNR
ncbi:thioredoxin domain-containing protein [Saccharicrinis aurantiacus]|uniref:thioredoxin domain-containing protein n=1 Tax=Saccharicrinis aurantiacus TaxID=1849719 RepID=UPI00094FFAD2|nr:thioredoxin domain-containing protein [Saccharicrinis aurantiacus]